MYKLTSKTQSDMTLKIFITNSAQVKIGMRLTSLQPTTLKLLTEAAAIIKGSSPILTFCHSQR
jgi:hypothetical protein